MTSRQIYSVMPTFGTVCDGIGCGHLAFNRAGFDCAWSAEIEPFPCAVLAHRFPGVPNLGDITADDFIERAKACGHIDVLIGGTPCQTFSVGGKREGVKDPRGQLTFRFLEIAERLRPEFVVWENVPGILSTDDGECFVYFLDELLRLGYIINCDVLDSQFFGVAQRRRRVFVSCQLAETLMKQKTLTSAITLAHTIGELSLDILNAHIAGCGNAPVFSDVPCENVSDGLRRKMLPFETVGAEVFQMWLENSEETFQNVPRDVEPLGSKVGLGTKTGISLKRRTAATLSSGSNEPPANGTPKSFSNTSLSLKKNWGEVFARARLYTTSTQSRPTTDPIIWQLFEAVVLTAECILPLKDSYPNFSTVGLSFLTTLKEFINYARQTDEPIFTEPGLYRLRGDILQQAERTAQSLADTRVECFGEVFPLSEGVRRDSPPSREKGEGVAHDLAPSLTSGGRGVERAGETRGQDPVVAVCPTLRAGGNATGGHRPPGTDVDTCDSLIPVHTTGDGYWRVGMGTLRAREQDSHENVVVMGHGQANAEIGKNVCPTLSCNHEEAPIATYDMRGNGDGVTVGCPTGDHAGRPTDYTPVVAIQERACSPDLNCGPGGKGFKEDGTAFTLEARNKVQAVAFEPRFVRTSGGQPSIELNPCLRADTNTGDGAPCVAIGIDEEQNAHVELMGCLKARERGGGFEGSVMTSSMQVRRLLPSECEALQGLPRNWTLIPWRGKPIEECPDGPRYKGIGNGQTVTVMEWLARRIMAEMTR